MPKLKSHKGLLKRIKITASGKVKHKRSGATHLNSHFRGKKTRELRQPMYLSNPEARRAVKMLHQPLQGRGTD